jgi:chromosome segregation ATPase
MSSGAPTVRSLDARVDDLETEFRQFMSELRIVVTLLKWIGGFSAATLLALIIQLFSISFAAGKLQERAESQATGMAKLQDKVDAHTSVLSKLEERAESQTAAMAKLQDKVDAQTIALGKLQERAATQTAATQELKQAISEMRKDLATLLKR